MSDELRRQGSLDGARALTKPERALLSDLLKSHPDRRRLRAQLDQVQVLPLADGGMGSLRFITARVERALGQLAVEAGFTDIDGAEGLIQINLDDVGDLFELDIWKFDFSPLKETPQPDRCHLLPLGKEVKSAL